MNILQRWPKAAPICAWAPPSVSGKMQGRCPLTFGILSTQLSLLDEAPEHLGFHENLQEAAQALGGDGFAEGLSLKGPLLTVAHRQEQGVMAHNLHKEADKGFRHHLVQGAGLRA